MIKEQKADVNIQRIWTLANGGEIYQPSQQEKQDAEGLKMINGMVVKDEKLPTGEIRSRIVVPLSKQREIIEQVHKQNHGGVSATINAVKQYHWFRGMKIMVRQVVASCPDCIARKGRPLTKEKLAPDERPMVLGGRWHIDGIILPPSNDFDHLIVATDVATKYVIIRPSKGETAEAANGILMDIIRRFGRPQEITTDRGRAFICELMMNACKGLFLKFKPVAVGQPQADGIVERVNRTLSDVASIVAKGNGSQWGYYVGEIEYIMNTRVSSVTKFTPYELVYGRLPPGPTYTDFIQSEDEGKTVSQQVRMLRNRINILQQLAHKNQMEAAGRQISYHDARAKAHEFNVGDTVYHYRPSEVEKGVTTKLAYKWAGPYKIAKKFGRVTFVLKDKDGKILKGTAHARQLYKPPDLKGKQPARRRHKRY